MTRRSGIRADIAVIGAAGISARYGITELDDDVAEVNRAAIAHSSRLVVLADASKIGVDAQAVVAPAGAISLLVTSAGAPEAELDQLRAVGVEIVVARGGAVRAGRQRHPGRTAAATPFLWQAGGSDGGRRVPDGQRRAAAAKEGGR